MHKVSSFVAYLAIFTIAARANPYSADKTFPVCAMQCMPELSSLLDTPVKDTYICTNEVLSDSLEQCVSANCSIRESLTTKNMTEAICHRPLRNRTKAISITAIVGISLALLAFVLRALARMTTGQFGIDDWAMTAAIGFVIPLSAMAVALAGRGLGKDIWSVSFDNITYILYIYYFDELLYLGSLTMIRLSILCLYLRIFPQQTFRSIIYVIMASNVVYGTAFVLLSIFQCIPVQAAWTRWDGTVPATCVNANALGWVSAGINIALDIIILILPLSGLTKLLMSWQRKIHILLMFCLGIFVIIVSILRLTSLVKFANTQNVTWDYVPVGYWSTIEVYVSVICACLPALPSLFRKKPPATINSPTGDRSTRTACQPKNRDSDVLPLLKVVTVL